MLPEGSVFPEFILFYSATAGDAWHNNCILYCMKVIKVFIGSQHEVVRYGLKALFEAHSPRAIQIVGEAADGFELIGECVDSRADVYILNLYMPGLNGINAVPVIKRKKPNSEVVIVSPCYDKILLEEILFAGAKGFVLNRSTGAEIIKAVEDTAKGKYFLCSEVSEEILQPLVTKISNGSGKNGSGRNGGVKNGNHGLTPRQMEILKLICDGLTEKEIGEKLYISFHTVHVHTTNIMRSLDLHTKADLVKYGIRNRLVPLTVSLPAYSLGKTEAFA
jgi:two-component system, NarL family, response regulator NreC